MVELNDKMAALKKESRIFLVEEKFIQKKGSKSYAKGISIDIVNGTRTKDQHTIIDNKVNQ